MACQLLETQQPWGDLPQACVYARSFIRRGAELVEV